MDPGFLIRPARDADAPGLIDLIGGVFQEYPGCVLELEGPDRPLLHIASTFGSEGGRFWVAEAEGRIAGCVGWTPSEENPRALELRKLYVRRDFRRRGLGGRLCNLVEEDAAARNALFVELWSDSRFRTAHIVYEGRGYARTGRTRELGDLSRTTEFHFRKLPIAPIWDAALGNGPPAG